MVDARDDYEGQDNSPMPPARFDDGAVDPATEATFDETLKDMRPHIRSSPGGLVDRAVWTLNQRVMAQPGTEPPAWVLALRDADQRLLERADLAGRPDLWCWRHENAIASLDYPKPWAEALGGSRAVWVARVAHATGGKISIDVPGMPAPSKLRQAPVSDHAGDPEWNAGPAPMNPFSPFSPFPEPVRRPAQPEVGTVLGFTKTFREGGQSYLFAAIRAWRRQAGWYLTGPQYSGKAYTWDALLDFIGGPAEWFRIGAVKSWTPLGDWLGPRDGDERDSEE